MLVGLLFLGYLFAVVGPKVGTFGFDAFAYWAVDIADPYVVPVGGLGAFTYTPVAARLFNPAGALRVVLVPVAVVGRAAGDRGLAGRAALPRGSSRSRRSRWSCSTATSTCLLAAMIVLGFRYPAFWVFGIFTKVTPGVGLVWFLVRREWRNLGIVLGLTAAIMAVSLLVDGQLWPEWIRYAISAESGAQVQQAQVPIPLLIRLPLAAVIVAWGAHTDRRWTVPVGVTLALPVLWPSGFAVLAACLATSSLAGAPLIRLGSGPGDPDRETPRVSGPHGSTVPVTERTTGT